MVPTEMKNLTDTTNIKAYVPRLGEKAIDLKKEEWDKGIIHIKIGEDGTILEGKLEL